jgi:hypothetical protein
MAPIIKLISVASWVERNASNERASSLLLIKNKNANMAKTLTKVLIKHFDYTSY